MQTDDGFTLIEVLVAFVIAALALSVLTQAGLDGIRGATLAARTQEAVARAQSHLAAIGDAPQPGDRQGDEGDGFHWHVRIAPLADASAASAPARNLTVGSSAPPAAAPPHITLLAVSVEISWGGGLHRAVELDSEMAVAGAATQAP